ncbi:MAG: cupin domain-containing protein [Desulfurococcales archaeon]|nr:cupin domain-containing protein [Desulfurococcales archaeon]
MNAPKRCGKVFHYTAVRAEELPADMAEGARIRWLIGPEDRPPTFYMRFFEVESNGHIKSHFHPWEHEIFVLEGSGRIRIGREIYEVGDGYVVFIPPNVEHEYWAYDRGLKFLCMIPVKPSAEERESPVEC